MLIINYYKITVVHIIDNRVLAIWCLVLLTSTALWSELYFAV